MPIDLKNKPSHKPDEKPQEPQIPENPVIPPETPEVPEQPKPLEPFKNRVPALWVLVTDEENKTVTGRNSYTNETFKGTREEFNARLKG